MNSPDIKLDERQAIYVTGVPGRTSWLEDLPGSLDSLSLDQEGNTLLKGEKERIVTFGQQKEIGVVVKCYCGAERKLRVCDLIEIVGILEVSEETDEVVLHAITLQQKSLHDIVLAKYPALSLGKFSLTSND